MTPPGSFARSDPVTRPAGENPSVSVLIPSWRRPERLMACLRSLAAQTHPPDEVAVVWQGQDEATRDAARESASWFGSHTCLMILHHPTPGIVPAENRALEATQGDLVLLIDDDAVAPVDWIARHLERHRDPQIGAVGGPARNHFPDGTPYPIREHEPIGHLGHRGRVIGNMYDHPDTWRDRTPRPVDHLVGYNLSLKRAAFDRFEECLKPYWQLFELEVCLQVRARGFQVVFDFGNVVQHHPTNATYAPGRAGDLNVKVINPAYNLAFILAKHTRRPLQLIQRGLWTFSVGTSAEPGPLALPWSIQRYGRPWIEMGLAIQVARARWEGWRAGRAARRTLNPSTNHVARTREAEEER